MGCNRHSTRWVPPALAAMEAEYPDVFAVVLKARAAAAERDEAQAADQARKAAALDLQAPAAILAGLAAAGVQLAVDPDGQIVAPAGAILTAEDRDQVARFKAPLVAALRAEAAARAAASRPMVIA